MEFFEKLGKKATETYKTASEKTNKIASDTKLKIKIGDNKSKIEDIYTEIGKKVYQKFLSEENMDMINIKEELKEDIEKIQALTSEIEQYESQRLDLSDKKQCPKCKNNVEKTVKFCPVCGAEQTEESEQETTEENKQENE